MDKKQIFAWTREWLVLSASVMFATFALDGIDYTNFITLLLVAATISLLNSFLRPLLLLLSLPFLIATLGLGMILVLWMINSFFLYLTGALFRDFYVASFGTAMLGAVFISVTQFCLNIIFGIPRKKLSIPRSEAPPPQKPRTRHREDDDGAIDI